MVEVISELEKKRKDHIRLIKKFAASISNKNTLPELLEDVARIITVRFECDDCFVYMLDDRNKFLVQHASYGRNSVPAPMINGVLKLPMNKGIQARSVKRSRSIMIKNLKRSKAIS